MTIKSASDKESSKAKGINEWLASPNAPFSIRHAQLLLLLEKDWQQAITSAPNLPPAQVRALAQSRIAGLTHDELVVTVATAAVRAKLDMLAPTLLAGLISRGWQVSRIRVRVQELADRQHEPARGNKRLISRETAQEIAQAAQKTHHIGIKQALKRLGRGATRSSAPILEHQHREKKD
jgi:hypothetical protein